MPVLVAQARAGDLDELAPAHRQRGHVDASLVRRHGPGTACSTAAASCARRSRLRLLQVVGRRDAGADLLLDQQQAVDDGLGPGRAARARARRPAPPCRRPAGSRSWRTCRQSSSRRPSPSPTWAAASGRTTWRSGGAPSCADTRPDTIIRSDLARRGAEHLGAEAGDVVSRRRAATSSRSRSRPGRSRPAEIELDDVHAIAFSTVVSITHCSRSPARTACEVLTGVTAIRARPSSTRTRRRPPAARRTTAISANAEGAERGACSGRAGGEHDLDVEHDEQHRRQVVRRS